MNSHRFCLSPACAMSEPIGPSEREARTSARASAFFRVLGAFFRNSNDLPLRPGRAGFRDLPTIFCRAYEDKVTLDYSF